MFSASSVDQALSQLVAFMLGFSRTLGLYGPASHPWGSQGREGMHREMKMPPPPQPERLFSKVCLIYCGSAHDVWKQCSRVWDTSRNLDLNLLSGSSREGLPDCLAIPSSFQDITLVATAANTMSDICTDDLGTLKHRKVSYIWPKAWFYSEKFCYQVYFINL